ncbi:DciA family protein [Coxiella endosymbiont of Dermacentor marginatus]|uniref:DciA family protein n=1 Tax=Coxiella endosymbiont of Dermacentor marginatus TaxID=1656159 RepID=UPI00222140EB|nr:DciA family protein [Coxiella endosymbiont of Dermacentor marginatus]
MQPSDPKPIKQCLQAGSLKLIVRKAKRILSVGKFLNQILPPEITPHYRIMNLSQETLILQLENAAWATRMRYLVPYLLEQFAQEDLGIYRIQCRVRPNLYT